MCFLFCCCCCCKNKRVSPQVTETGPKLSIQMTSSMSDLRLQQIKQGEEAAKVLEDRVVNLGPVPPHSQTRFWTDSDMKYIAQEGKEIEKQCDSIIQERLKDGDRKRIEITEKNLRASGLRI